MHSRNQIRAGVATLLTLTVAGLMAWTERLESYSARPFEPVAQRSFSRALRLLPFYRPSDLPAEINVPVPGRIQRGETLGGLLEKAGLSAPEAERLIEGSTEWLDPRKLRVGDFYETLYASSGEVVGLSFEVADRGRVGMSREGGDWLSDWRPFTRSSRVRQVGGVLNGSLEAALAASEAPTSLALGISKVLQWDLDFHRDLRQGDRFAIVFEEVTLDGRRAGIGEILAVRYENRGKVFENYRYGESGHYDENGRPTQKLFLRSPLPYSRITSGYSTSRLHPVTKVTRPHWGVDYGAPVGTPVRVTASGVVASAGWNSGGGNTIMVRHANDYVTGYLHLSRFARGVSAGARVSQGDVIGYVGATGLATGPHLDYRVKHRDRWINPASLRSEPAPPIPASELPIFRERRDALRSQLESVLAIYESDSPESVSTAASAGP